MYLHLHLRQSLHVHFLSNIFWVFTVGDHRVHSHATVLWLHSPDGLHVLDSNRNHRILCRLFLHPKNIWGHQNRLILHGLFSSRLTIFFIYGNFFFLYFKSDLLYLILFSIFGRHYGV